MLRLQKLLFIFCHRFYSFLPYPAENAKKAAHEILFSQVAFSVIYYAVFCSCPFSLTSGVSSNTGSFSFICFAALRSFCILRFTADNTDDFGTVGGFFMRSIQTNPMIFMSDRLSVAFSFSRRGALTHHLQSMRWYPLTGRTLVGILPARPVLSCGCSHAAPHHNH